MPKHTKGEQVQIAQSGDMGQENLSLTRIEQVEYPISPLPSSAEVQGYENAVPGAGDRILQIFENQVNHRIDIEKQLVVQQVESEKEGVKQRSMAMVIGALTIWALILLSIVFAMMGMREASYTAIILPITSFAVYLLKFTFSSKRA